MIPSPPSIVSTYPRPRPAGVVVGIDASPDSLAALRWAVARSVERGDWLEVVHCRGVSPLSGALRSSSSELHAASMSMLRAEVAAAAVTELGSPSTVALVSTPGSAIHTLLARGTRASLLVVGARGHSSVIGQRFGEIATACLWHASCPVVTVDRGGTLIHSGDLRPHLAASGISLLV